MKDSYFKTGFPLFASQLYRALPRRLLEAADGIRSYGVGVFTLDKIFIHIPKTGGVSISKVIYGQEIKHMRQTELDRIYLPDAQRTYVAVVRNPIERFLSAANFLRTGGTATRSADFKKIYKKINWGALSSIIDYVEAEAPEKLDHVFRPQSYYLDGPQDVLALYTIENSIPMLAKEFGLCISFLPNENISNKTYGKACLSEKDEARLLDIYKSDWNYYLSAMGQK